jgi:hypothetical protein
LLYEPFKLRLGVPSQAPAMAHSYQKMTHRTGSAATTLVFIVALAIACLFAFTLPFFSSYLDFFRSPHELLSSSNSGSDELNGGCADGSAESGKWNQLYHLGGESPWIRRITNVVSEQDGGTVEDPPRGCTVKQVHYIGRHGERYPTLGAGLEMIALLQRLKEYDQEHDGGLKGLLSFVKDWQFFSQGMIPLSII